MKKVRFMEEFLQYEDGTIASVTYEEILDACLSGDFDTVSIFEIVSKGVEKITGAKVVKNQYRKSSLFNSLEQEIRNTARYSAKKEETIALSREYREKARKAHELENRMKSAIYGRFSSKAFHYNVKRYK